MSCENIARYQHLHTARWCVHNNQPVPAPPTCQPLLNFWSVPYLSLHGCATGNITLSFSYPVELSKLQAALRVTGAANIAVKVTPCPPPDFTFYPIFARAGVTGPPTTPANTTCAVVRLNPALGVAQAATLELPAGSRYNSLAGPLGKAQGVKVFGLRRFRVPLRQDFQEHKDGQDVYDGIK